MATQSRAATQTEHPLESFEYGYICDFIQQGRESEAPDTNAGRVRRGGGTLEFDVQGDQIPGLPGVAFGIQFVTDPAIGEQMVTMVTHHPSFGPGYLESESWPSLVTGGTVSARYFYFEYDYELVPGPWTMEVFLGDELIVRQDFTVFDGPAARALMNACPADGMLS